MRKTLSILCAACALILTFSCKEEIPASLEVAPTELTWEWDDTDAQTVTVTANYDWTATVSDEANWTVTPAVDGSSLSVAPKADNKTADALTATVTITCKELIKTINCTQAGNPYNGHEHEYVDLGLSVKWATCNVGAETETDNGSYFAWGETAEETDYSWGTYTLGTYDSSAKPDYGMTKYNKTAGPTALEATDDPATANWGSKWRTPTSDENKEILNDTNCEWLWETKKDAGGTDVNGYTVTSKINSNSIFLPAAGYRNETGLKNDGKSGNYWSSSLIASSPSFAYYFGFNSDSHDRSNIYRYYGQSVRAVTE